MVPDVVGEGPVGVGDDVAETVSSVAQYQKDFSGVHTYCHNYQ